MDRPLNQEDRQHLLLRFQILRQHGEDVPAMDELLKMTDQELQSRYEELVAAVNRRQQLARWQSFRVGGKMLDEMKDPFLQQIADREKTPRMEKIIKSFFEVAEHISQLTDEELGLMIDVLHPDLVTAINASVRF